MASKAYKADDNKIVSSSNDKANEKVINSSKNLTPVPNIRVIRELIFLISNTKNAFNYLQIAFIKASILEYYDLKSYILIKTNVLDYIIYEILN